MLLRRQHITLFLQSLLILLACVSCTSDDVADSNVSKPTDTSGTPGYLTFQVLFDKETGTNRALGESEHFVQDNEHGLGGGSKLLLFDGNDKFLEMLDLPLTDTEEKDDYIEVRYTTQLTQLDNDSIQWPSGCLLVLNPSEQAQAELDKLNEGDAMSQALNIVCEESDPRNIGYSNANRQYYTMTNTIYVDGKGDLVTAAKIDPSKITTNPNDSNNIMTIRVERMVAKCTFHLQNDSSLIYTPQGVDPLVFFDGISEDGHIQYASVKNWRVKVTGWGINGLETKNNLFKRITPNAAYFGNGMDWNDTTYYRAYWSEDPHYGGVEKYPWQYRFAVDNEATNFDYYMREQSPLQNYSYNNFVGQTEDEEDEGFDRIVYVPENTYGSEVINQDLDSRTNMLAGTHLIVCAELQIEDEEAADGYSTINLYRDRNNIYYKSEKDCFVSLVHSFNYTLSSNEAMKFYYYDWEKGGDKKSLLAKPDKTCMLYYKDEPLTNQRLADIYNKMDSATFTELYRPMVEAIVMHGDGKILPWFEDEDGTPLLSIKPLPLITEQDTIKSKDGLGYDIIPGKTVRSEADYNDIKSIFYEWLGAIDHFNQGKMYYPAPILHHGADYPEKASQKRLGDYGVVRNSWYKFNVKDIRGIGTPVDKPDDPIVPDRVEANDIIHVMINIIGWHEFNADVPLF